MKIVSLISYPKIVAIPIFNKRAKMQNGELKTETPNDSKFEMIVGTPE